MSATVLEPESDDDSRRAMPLVTLAGAGLTAWAAWQSAHHDWRPLWLYPPLLLVLMSGVIGLAAPSVVGIRRRRGLKHVTTTLDRSHLVIGDDARLTVVTELAPRPQWVRPQHRRLDPVFRVSSPPSHATSQTVVTR